MIEDLIGIYIKNSTQMVDSSLSGSRAIAPPGILGRLGPCMSILCDSKEIGCKNMRIWASNGVEESDWRISTSEFCLGGHHLQRDS